MNCIYERKINYYETDKMGVVHHSNYIRFLEEARCYYLEQNGFPYSKMEEIGMMIPVLGVNVEYKTHVTFDDTLLIKVHFDDITPVRMTVTYDVRNKTTGDIVIIAKTKHCFTDLNVKPVNTKKVFPEIYNKFIELNKENIDN